MIPETPENTQESTTPEPAKEPADLIAGASAAIEMALDGKEAAPAQVEPATTLPAKEAEVSATMQVLPTEPSAEQSKGADEEIADLGIKSDKAKDRFRELSGYKSAVHQAGIENLDDLPNIVERAKFADELESVIVSTGASPEQYANAIQYLALVNSRQPASMQKAYEVMQGELAALAKALGKEAPGIHDPLKDHPDLAQEYENGEISKARALEIASQRAAHSLTQAQYERTQAQTAQQQEHQRAVSDLNALGAKLQASDPLYADKIAALRPTIELIRERCPPSEWPQRVAAAYQQVALPAAARQSVQAPLPPPGPVRSVVPAGVSMVGQAKSAEDAIAMALAAMNGVR